MSIESRLDKVESLTGKLTEVYNDKSDRYGNNIDNSFREQIISWMMPDYSRGG